MDSTIETNISNLLMVLWTYFYGSQPASNFPKYAGGGTAFIQVSEGFGYSGAGLAFFLSLAGAYIAGAKVIKEVENSFFTFLEDFQDNDEYMEIIEDKEKGPSFGDFLTIYAVDLAIVTIAAFWHVVFLIGMGFTTSFLIFFKLKRQDNTKTIPIFLGFELLFYGLLVGFTNFIAGNGLTVNKNTLVKLVSFSATTEDDTSAEQKEFTNQNGNTVTQTTSITQAEETKKDFFSLYEMAENWGNLYLAQYALQFSLPLVYIGMLEIAVIMVFTWLGFFIIFD